MIDLDELEQLERERDENPEDLMRHYDFTRALQKRAPELMKIARAAFRYSRARETHVRLLGLEATQRPGQILNIAEEQLLEAVRTLCSPQANGGGQ